MSHYTANLRDLEFNLFEFLDTKDRFGTGPFEQMDAETARGVLAEIRRLAEGPLAESFTDADRNPPVFDPATHSVTLPESFKKSVRALNDGEWFRLGLASARPRRCRGRRSRWCSARTPPSSCTGPAPRSRRCCTTSAPTSSGGWPS
jgi:hypothetical protein